MPIVVTARRATRDSGSPEGGFTLVEVLVALTLVVAVMLSAGVFFTRSMKGTGLHQQRQAAVALGDQAMELARAVPPSRMVNGRSQLGVDGQWAAAGSVVTSKSFKVYDALAGTSSTPAIPFESQARVNNVQYTIRTFVDGCYLGSAGGVCGPTVTAGATQLYRLTVDVRWDPGPHQTCGGSGGRCDYVVSTLVDPSTNATFNTSG